MHMTGREHADQNRQMAGGVSLMRRWAEYLVAVLAGNIAYMYMEPGLPTFLRHRVFRIDLGLGIDFLICVALYFVVRLARPWTGGGDAV